MCPGCTGDREENFLHSTSGTQGPQGEKVLQTEPECSQSAGQVSPQVPCSCPHLSTTLLSTPICLLSHSHHGAAVASHQRRPVTCPGTSLGSSNFSTQGDMLTTPPPPPRPRNVYLRCLPQHPAPGFLFLLWPLFCLFFLLTIISEGSRSTSEWIAPRPCL